MKATCEHLNATQGTTLKLSPRHPYAKELSEQGSHETLTPAKLGPCQNKHCPNLRSEDSSLCEHCERAQQQHDFCYYCRQIYFNIDDGQAWVQCDDCCKWVHVDCETEHNRAFDPQILLLQTTVYFCPRCQNRSIPRPKIKKQRPTPLLPAMPRSTPRARLQEYQQLAGGKGQVVWCVRKQEREGIQVGLSQAQVLHDMQYLHNL